MRTDEAATLVAEARAIYPGMSIVPGIVDAWCGVLGDLTVADCRAALLLHGQRETRIPVPADVRRLVLAARQDAALRELPTDPRALIPKPDWFDATVRQHQARTHAENELRKERGERPSYGEMIRKPSDGTPRAWTRTRETSW